MTGCPPNAQRQTTLSASITADNKQLPYGRVQNQKRDWSKTRVSVAVRDTLYGPSRLSDSAFISPKHSNKRLIRRVKGAARLPWICQQGHPLRCSLIFAGSRQNTPTKLADLPLMSFASSCGGRCRYDHRRHPEQRLSAG